MIARLVKANNWLAVLLTGAMASMIWFWVYTIVCLVPLGWPSSLPSIQFLCSGWFQGAAFFIIGVGSKLMGQAAEQRAIEDHAALVELLNALHKQQTYAAELQDALHPEYEAHADLVQSARDRARRAA